MKRYSHPEIERALRFLARASGSAPQAAKALADAGHEPIPERTLTQWRSNTYRERYEALRGEFEDAIDRELAEDMTELERERIHALRLTLSKYV